MTHLKIPGIVVKVIVGTMNFFTSADNIIEAILHIKRACNFKLLWIYTLPLTGVSFMKIIGTNLALLKVIDDLCNLLERTAGVTV